MKIKSITLITNEETLTADDKKVAFKYLPFYQIKYEESTRSGLTATGTMEADVETAEKISKFFADLENEQDKGYTGVWGVGGVTAKLNNEYILSREAADKMFNTINIVNINESDIESTVEDFAKRLVEQLKKQRGRL